MILYIEGHEYHYEFENLCRLFFPREKIKVVYTYEEEEVTVSTRCEKGVFCASIKAGDYYREEKIDDTFKTARNREQTLARAVFALLLGYTGFTPKWGIITGVRPVKLLRLVLDEEQTMDKARQVLLDTFCCSEEKADLAIRTIRREEAITAASTPSSYSLYISIPFCPTRCDYCSFVSQSIEKSNVLTDEYVPMLIRELKAIANNVKQFPLQLETVYMGGGTPTTLSAEQLSQILNAVHTYFDTSKLKEFTVEAGRPDTITPEKLAAIKNAGVGRISINPQTFNDEVLNNIGRKHTSEQTLQAYQMAQDCGFPNINMDIIAGLPGDTPESFLHTLQTIQSLDPQSVTVHTLALKRSSNLVMNQTAQYRAFDAETAQMLCDAEEALGTGGYEPYYLYRQSRTVGNLENVGWSKPGFEGLYNVYIIDETHTILAAGAGGISKLKQPRGPKIERIFNFKLPLEYMKNFNEMLNRKDDIGRFYRAHQQEI